jgi:GT2 family glycosyltransferase
LASSLAPIGGRDAVGGHIVISVIIVNHNGEAHLRRCLESLENQGPDLEILLVDNASTDGSVAIVKDDFSQVRLIEHDSNVGFAAANNIAAGAAAGNALLLLNVDAWLEEGALDLLAKALDHDPRLAVAAPRLLYPDGSLQFGWSPTRGVVGEALQQLRNRFENRPWAHGRTARMAGRIIGRNWFTAACVLLRAAAFRDVGGFDERFFMYFEDVDLCIRLENAGWRLAEVDGAVARHVGGFARNSEVDEIYRPSQLLYYRLHRPDWEARLVERRLRKKYGDTTVDGWLPVERDP